MAANIGANSVSILVPKEWTDTVSGMSPPQQVFILVHNHPNRSAGDILFPCRGVATCDGDPPPVGRYDGPRCCGLVPVDGVCGRFASFDDVRRRPFPSGEDREASRGVVSSSDGSTGGVGGGDWPTAPLLPVPPVPMDDH